MYIRGYEGRDLHIQSYMYICCDTGFGIFPMDSTAPSGVSQAIRIVHWLLTLLVRLASYLTVTVILPQFSAIGST